MVKGSGGTVLFIAANSLVDNTGAPITSGVVIALKEHYTFADFITSNLQTVHNNDILQNTRDDLFRCAYQRWWCGEDRIQEACSN